MLKRLKLLLILPKKDRNFAKYFAQNNIDPRPFFKEGYTAHETVLLASFGHDVPNGRMILKAMNGTALHKPEQFSGYTPQEIAKSMIAAGVKKEFNQLIKELCEN